MSAVVSAPRARSRSGKCQKGVMADCPCEDCARRCFAAMAVRFEPLIAKYLMRLLGNPSDVSDVIQEMYVRLLRGGARCGSTYESPGAFLRTVAKRIALDRLDQQRSARIEYRHDLENIEVQDESADLEGWMHAHQNKAALWEAIGQLPRRCREVFLLRKMHGLPQKQIARLLAISENTIEQHVLKASRRLRETFAQFAVKRQNRPSSPMRKAA